MMSDHDRLASLFTPVGVLRMPNADIEFASREEIRDGSSHLNCALYHDRYQRTPDGLEVRRAHLRGQVRRHHAAARLGTIPTATSNQQHHVQ
ncbi:MAG TPA: hypothetical protein VGR06_28165 [Actinophytocola sp.]|jgi:hypothetical protein|uniref:hypothetical protein n=1 Tax=Actinophytocola sp. TaxID=1872138 RepID=UPI002E03C6E5|nr:hypothetical protein [Actinophytocola sp.]